MEASHKKHRPHIKVAKDAEEEELKFGDESIWANLELCASLEGDVLYVLAVHQFDLLLCVHGRTVLGLVNAILHNQKTHVYTGALIW